MNLVKERFPQVELEPFPSEDEMINAIVGWRRRYTDFFQQFLNDIDADADDILRFDTCVNGYGTPY